MENADVLAIQTRIEAVFANTERIPTAAVFVGRSEINRIWGNQPDKPHIGNVASNADGGRERT
jgi:hypothetical protein